MKRLRLSRSTRVLCAMFVATLGLYLLVRPASPPAPNIGSFVVPTSTSTPTTHTTSTSVP